MVTYFPLTFPYIFGLQPIASETLAVNAETSAAMSVERFAESVFEASASMSSSCRLDLTAESELAISAEQSSVSDRETFGVADSSVDVTTSADSQEDGVAETSLFVTATPTAVLAVEKFIDSELSIAATHDTSGHRSANTGCEFSAIAESFGDYGGPNAIVPLKFETLADQFNTKDTTKWSGWTGGVDVIDGKLVMPASGGGSIYTTGNVNTGQGVYDLNHSYVVINLVQPPNTDDGTPYCRLEIRPQYSTTESTQACIRSEYIAGHWKLRQVLDNGSLGPVTTVPYSQASWIRVRLDDDMLYWDTSVNGIDWATPKEESVLNTGYHSSSLSISVSPGVSLDPGTAIWDQLNSLPRAFQASLAVFADTTGVVGSRNQNISAEFAAEADESAENRYDAQGQADLIVTSMILSEMLRELYVDSSLDISVDGSSDGTEFGVADTDLAAVLSTSGSVLLDQPIESDFAATAGFLSTVSHGQDVVTDLFLEALGYASLKATYPAAASLPVYAFPTAVAIRNARVAASLAASIATESDSTEFGVADTALQVSAIGSGGLSRGQPMEAMTGVFATIAVTAVLQHQIAASLAFNAWHTATADEPFAIVVVKVDNRTAKVSISSRVAKVISENRVVLIPSATRST